MIVIFILFCILIGLIVLGTVGTVVFIEVYGWDSKYVMPSYLTAMVSCLLCIILSPLFGKAILYLYPNILS
jgi:hypothetical protein